MKELSINNDKQKFNITFSIIVQLLFLAAYSFNLLAEYNYIILFWVAFVCLTSANYKIPNVNEFKLLCITFVLYLLSYIFSYTYTEEVYFKFLIAPIFCYIWGYNILQNRSDRLFYLVVFVVIWSMFVHGMLTTIMHIESGSVDRNPIDFSTKHIIPATLHGFFFTMMVSLLYYTVFINKNFLFRVLTGAAIVFSIYATLYHASRTLLVVLVLVLVIVMLYHMKNMNDSYSKIKLFVAIAFLLVLGIVLYNIDAFGVKTSYEESNMYARVNHDNYTSLSEDGRIERSIIVLKNALFYPFGGMVNEVHRYAHNLWLDTIRTAGTIPALFLILYTIYNFKNLSKFLKNTNISFDKRIIILSLYVGMYSNFFVEPVLEGYPIYFSLSCMFNGMVKSMIEKATPSTIQT